MKHIVMNGSNVFSKPIGNKAVIQYRTEFPVLFIQLLKDCQNRDEIK